jgi:hypothetical protein
VTPVVGVSTFDVVFVVFAVVVVTRDSVGWKEVADGVLGGNGGNDDEVASVFSPASTFEGDVMILRTLGVVFFSAAFVTG